MSAKRLVRVICMGGVQSPCWVVSGSLRQDSAVSVPPLTKFFHGKKTARFPGSDPPAPCCRHKSPVEARGPPPSGRPFPAVPRVKNTRGASTPRLAVQLPGSESFPLVKAKNNQHTSATALPRSNSYFLWTQILSVFWSLEVQSCLVFCSYWGPETPAKGENREVGFAAPREFLCMRTWGPACLKYANRIYTLRI